MHAAAVHLKHDRDIADGPIVTVALGLLVMLDVIEKRGVPNFFGPQRFGLRGDTWEIGQALLQQDFQTAVELVAGRPGPLDTGPVLKARELFAQQRYDDAASVWPYGFRDCIRICRIMARTHGNAKRAMLSLDRKMLPSFPKRTDAEVTRATMREVQDAVETWWRSWLAERAALRSASPPK